MGKPLQNEDFHERIGPRQVRTAPPAAGRSAARRSVGSSFSSLQVFHFVNVTAGIAERPCLSTTLLALTRQSFTWNTICPPHL
jgi:hypothetical protein